MTDDRATPRKIVAVLTDSEWRTLRVDAAAHDTTIQGWVTSVVLAAVQAAADHADGAPGLDELVTGQVTGSPAVTATGPRGLPTAVDPPHGPASRPTSAA